MKSFLRFVFVGVALVVPWPMLANSKAVRVVVHKKQFPQFEAGSLPASVLDQAAGAGFSLLADYASMAVFKGPSVSVSRLLSTIQAEGRDAEVASDLERFAYHDAVMDAETGPQSLAPAGQVYFLTLQTYAKFSWLQELSDRGVRILQALPPAAYIVRADASVASSLAASLPWVRGVFPLPTNLKAIGFDRPPDTSGPFRDVVIRATEESAAESLRPLLESLSDTPVSAKSDQPGQMTYFASLTELDVQTLTFIDRVFEIAPAGHPTVSSERQAQLIGEPGSVTGNGQLCRPITPIPISSGLPAITSLSRPIRSTTRLLA